jgi:hypothetical protein
MASTEGTMHAFLVSALALCLMATPERAPFAAQRDTGGLPSAMTVFPFRYSGRLEREGLPPLAVLTRGADTLLVSVGDTVDSVYRLDEVSPRYLVVTNVRLEQKYTIELSSTAVTKPAEAPTENPATPPRTPLGTRGPACC